LLLLKVNLIVDTNVALAWLAEQGRDSNQLLA